MTHTCPRRFELGGAYHVVTEFDQDEYDPRPPAGHLACSYCGSMMPDTFLHLVSTGVPLGPTDKPYKVYVELDGAVAKFYFQHLSEDQKHAFIDSYNHHGITFTPPGDFYVLPYFMARG